MAEILVSDSCAEALVGIASVRSAFLVAANGRIRLDHAGLS